MPLFDSTKVALCRCGEFEGIGRPSPGCKRAAANALGTKKSRAQARLFEAIRFDLRLIAAVVRRPLGARRIVFAFVITAVAGGEALYIVDGTLVREMQERMANDFAVAIEAQKNVSVDPFPVDFHKDCGIILFAILRVSGDEEGAAILAENAWLAVSQTEDRHPDPAAIFRPDLDADYQIALDLDIIPGAEKVARLPIERIARLRIGGSGAQ